MATLDYKRYHDNKAVGRTNEYILNGHGDALSDPPSRYTESDTVADETERVNCYILDGHGGNTPYFAHRCPQLAETASAYMNTLRAHYEEQNGYKAIIRGDSKRRDVCHLQFFVSFAESENVSAEEMLTIARKLIDRSALRDYACLVVPHENTWQPDDPENPGNKHFHISCCPYPLPGNSKKLSMNDKLKQEMQKTMDKICVEHGYSIIASPSLLADPDYRQWFEQVSASGKVPIHPYHPEKRQRRTHKSKQRNAASRVRKYTRTEIRYFNLMRRLGIYSLAGLDRHLKNIGKDISVLRKEVAMQNSVLDTMGPLLALIKHWEDTRSPSAKAALMAQNVQSLEDVKYKAEVARARLEKTEALLKDRKKEYGQLKRAMNVMDKDMWQAIINGSLPDDDYDSDIERIKRADSIRQEYLEQEEERLRLKLAEENETVFYSNPKFISTKTSKPYRVPLYDIYGHKLTNTQTLFHLAMCVITEEYDRWLPTEISPSQQQIIYAKPDFKVQMMIDSIEIAREENIQKPSDVQYRLQEVGDDKARFKRLKFLERTLQLAEAEQYVYGPEYNSLEQRLRMIQDQRQQLQEEIMQREKEQEQPSR